MYSLSIYFISSFLSVRLFLVYSSSGDRFLTEGVFECDIAHRRSVAALCMLYKIKCNLMHPLYGALPVPYVAVRVTRGALVAHRYTLVPPCCRMSQHSKTFIPL